ncbi:50S ribosomal protein L10 [Chloroflexota bacterium]
MSKEKKAQVIDKLHESFVKCRIGILTDYRGLTTSEMMTIRSKLRETGIQYKVVKNTLARFAAERDGRDDLAKLFVGPVAIAFGYGDMAVPAKILIEYIQSSKASLAIKGGFLSNRILNSEDITILSTLPAREILVANVLGRMKSPVTALVGCLTTPLRGFLVVLQARIKQLEEQNA